MNAKDGTVLLIDADKKAVAGSIAVGGALEFAAADGEGKVFVNVEDKNEVAVLDISGRKVTARYPLPGCDEPSGLALDAADHVLLSVCANGKAVATSATDGHVVATLAIGSHPDAVIFDEKNKRFLVPCGGDGVLSVVNVTDGHLAAGEAVPTAKGARTGAIDPATGKVYLPTADFQPAKAGERPAAIPGTFRLLVLGQS
jgi:DNA-binding beta-propeller fold protein YncE